MATDPPDWTATDATVDTDEPDRNRVTGIGTRRTQTVATGVYAPYRRVVFTTDDGERLPLDGVDVDVTVTHPGDGTLSWTVVAYSLATRIWEHLRMGTTAEIRLGWADGPQQTVVRGPIQLMRPQPWQTGRRYVFRGTSAAGASLGRRVSKTWTDEPPHSIARDLAQIAGLDIGHIESGTPVIEGNWTITNARPLSRWFGELTKEVAADTDLEWSWYVHAGRLYFVPRGTPTGPPLKLGGIETGAGDGATRYPSQTGGDAPKPRRPTPAIGADPTTGTPRTIPRSRRFRRHLEPELYRGRAVDVIPPGSADADHPEPLTHAVGSYQFESSSRTGRHYVFGSLVPTTGEYRPLWVRDSDRDPMVAAEEQTTDGSRGG